MRRHGYGVVCTSISLRPVHLLTLDAGYLSPQRVIDLSLESCDSLVRRRTGQCGRKMLWELVAKL
jgi:hypothetical protein